MPLPSYILDALIVHSPFVSVLNCELMRIFLQGAPLLTRSQPYEPQLSHVGWGQASPGSFPHGIAVARWGLWQEILPFNSPFVCLLVNKGCTQLPSTWKPSFPKGCFTASSNPHKPSVEQSSRVKPPSPCCSVASEYSWAGTAKFATGWNMQRVPVMYSWKIISYLEMEPHLFPPTRGESGLNPCLIFPQPLQNTEHHLQLGAWLSLCFLSSGKNSFSWCRLYLHLYLFICIHIFMPYFWKVKRLQLF